MANRWGNNGNSDFILGGSKITTDGDCSHEIKRGLLLGRKAKTNLESERGESKSWLKTQHSENEDHGIRSHHFMGNRWGNSGNSIRLYFWGASKSLQMVIAAMKLKDAYSLEEKL